MTLGALPHTVEVRTLAAQHVTVSGVLDAVRMPRLMAAIHSSEAPAIVEARFDRDEERRYVLDLSVTMPVAVSCQRCLDPMPVKLVAHSQLAALWSDDQAQHLPLRYDPLITGEETDLWQVVEDELLLALPAFSYHDDPDCGEVTGRSAPRTEPDTMPDAPQENDNPFGVLATLKKDGHNSE